MSYLSVLWFHTANFFLQSLITTLVSGKIKQLKKHRTEVDDGDSRGALSDREDFDDGLDEVEYQSPVVYAGWIVVAYTAGVVDHEHDVRVTRCNVNETHCHTFLRSVSHSKCNSKHNALKTHLFQLAFNN